MSIFNEGRIAAVAMLRQLGYALLDGALPACRRVTPCAVYSCGAPTHSRAEGSPDEVELKAIFEAIEAYKARRWPEEMGPRSKRER